MTRDILAFIGGVLLCGFGAALVCLAFHADGRPLLACLAFACGVACSGVGYALMRETVEVLRDRR